MNVFEFAMKMEQDGKAYYEKMAQNAGNASIKKILLDLANDELKHYNIFKKFSEGDFSGVAELKTTGTKVLETAQNVFQQIATSGKKFEFTSDIRSAWEEAQKVEKKSEDFYRIKAEEETNNDVKKTLKVIADEEHKHWALIEHVLQFIDRPKQWLEDAEWHHLDQY
ncbi:MAG: hypothetical protein CVT49_07655 [candidate division Zixibacteria bacterium HGW-Zixibacteria-1]|nr:MAG: hypothetical protein CVT49_07655 [candidate division Zixibacteria bacterium HGW-Zixibacteria-1]